MDDLHTIGQTVLRALALILNVHPNESFERYHRPDVLSTSAFGMLKYSTLREDRSLPQIGHGAHTDVGSLTFLFSTDRGLQFQEPGSEAWQYVEPKSGCAIVNIGDSLHFLSAGRLQSCLHRVVPLPGVEVVDRFSCAYFMRPEYEASFSDSSGTLWRSLNWHDEKYAIFRASIPQQKKSNVLTGKSGYVGLWEPENLEV